jgi:formylglycine-generating enzyme required for sulfatase activity
MKFVPVPGTSVLFSIWETRRGDFAAFAKETGYDATTDVYSLGTNRWKQMGDTWKNPGFPQTDRHPVCGVNWNDAQAFCDWLSKKEGRKYRLPTDVEWSAAVGLTNEPGATPKARSEKIQDVYPWGREMPPNVNGLPAGNYPGSEAAETNWPAQFRVIEGFRDPFARTAPVGSFPPNAYGIYDLGGNCWEWGQEEFEPGKEAHFVRGGSWVDNLPAILLSSYRHYSRPVTRNTSVGFRCVLVPE